MDCVIIGYNDVDFERVVEEVRSMGEDNVAFRDLNMNFIELDGKPHRAQDALTKFYQGGEGAARPFRNYDLLWPSIMPIGSFLHARGLSFDYINDFKAARDQLKGKLLGGDVLTVAITTTIYISEIPILDVIAYIRKYNREVKIIVGGPYMSKQTEEKDSVSLQAFLKYIDADFYVFSKEGEYALYRILIELKGDKEFHSIDNIAFRENGAFSVTPASGEDNSLNENPINYSLFPRHVIGEYVNVKTSKSCPFECAFCAFPLRAERYVYTDEEWIKSQLDAIREAGAVKNIFFSDDTFNIPLSRFKGIMRMMIREKYPFRWHCFYRCVNSDEEAIMLMKEAGCTGVFLGIESGNDTILAAMSKKARRMDYAAAIPMFRKHGILTFASIFFGFPGETYETVKDTMNLIDESEPDFCRPLVWYCDTTTPVWRDREKYGIKGTSFNWSHNTMNARMACDLMEDAFLSLKSPTVYVPDPGFNFISIYYLMQRGFTVGQVKRFLTAFNIAVKVKMLTPGHGGLPIRVLNNLRSSCIVAPGEGKADEGLEKQYSGETYREALDYWVGRFKGYAAGSGLQTRTAWKGGMTKNVNFIYPKTELEFCSAVYRRTTLLAAFVYLLSWLEGGNDIVLIVMTSSGSAFPLRILINRQWRYSELVRYIEAEWETAERLQLYAFHLLSNPYRIQRYECEVPEFRYVFQEYKNMGKRKIGESIDSYPSIHKGITLGLNARVLDNSTVGSSDFDYDPSAIEPESIRKIKDVLAQILGAGIRNCNVLLSDIRINESIGAGADIQHRRARKYFKF